MTLFQQIKDKAIAGTIGEVSGIQFYTENKN